MSRSRAKPSSKPPSPKTRRKSASVAAGGAVEDEEISLLPALLKGEAGCLGRPPKPGPFGPPQRRALAWFTSTATSTRKVLSRVAGTKASSWDPTDLCVAHVGGVSGRVGERIYVRYQLRVCRTCRARRYQCISVNSETRRFKKKRHLIQSKRKISDKD